jgi:uncharacterized protein YndB with AHSA1/START domain
MKGYPTVVSPSEIRFERLLPGSIETVWAFLTESRKRGEWLASGPMELSPDQAPPPDKYAKMDAEGHRAEETVTVFDPPHRLAFTWGGGSEVMFELAPKDGKVLLTLTHRALPTEAERNGTAGGWHCHLTILAEKLEGRTPPAFWDVFRKIDAEYANGIPR